MIKLGVSGATGRIGKEVLSLVQHEYKDRIKTICEISSDSTAKDLAVILEEVDVVIDFSSPIALELLLETIWFSRIKLVIGTTGLADSTMDRIKNYSCRNAVFYSPNMSLGSHLLLLSALSISGALGSEYDIDISDVHHISKKDRPSGTALMYGQKIAAARSIKTSTSSFTTRGEREKNVIEYNSVRAGSCPGEHVVTFTSSDESISISHKIFNRKIFACGALKAAIMLSKKDKGIYSMSDMYDF